MGGTRSVYFILFRIASVSYYIHSVSKSITLFEYRNDDYGF